MSEKGYEMILNLLREEKKARDARLKEMILNVVEEEKKVRDARLEEQKRDEQAKMGVMLLAQRKRQRQRQEDVEEESSRKRQKGGFFAEQTENAATGSDDWDNVYSDDEKRLKFLADRQGYGKWEEQNRLWEIQNGLVPIAEELSAEEEKEVEATRQRKKDILLALSSRSLEKEKKGEEVFYKRLQQLRIKPLTEEEKKLKESYLENAEKARLGIIKFEDFHPYGPGWDLAFYDHPPVEKLDPKPKPPPSPSPSPALLFQYLAEAERRHSERGFTIPVRSKSFATAEGRCTIGPYLTPYCKCDPNCCKYPTFLTPKEYPPEISQISHAYSRQCRQSHYFDIDDAYDGAIYPVEPPFTDAVGNSEITIELANRAIQEYNEKESNVFKYKFLKIEKMNMSMAMYDTFWMTVKVLNLTLGTPIETFQIHACFSRVNDHSDVLCYRPKEERIIGLPSCEVCFGLLPGRVTGGQEP